MNLTILFLALLQLEGPSGDAKGPYAIRPDYVKDANEILGRVEFAYPADCEDHIRARQMMRIVINHYRTTQWLPRDYLAFHRLGYKGMRDGKKWTDEVKDYVERGERIIEALEKE